MKRYKINTGANVNKHASKTGIKWEYAGKVDNYDKRVEAFERNIEWYRELKESGCATMMGLRVTDTETNEVVYEKTIY